jgi:hypothetical protein
MTCPRTRLGDSTSERHAYVGREGRSVLRYTIGETLP